MSTSVLDTYTVTPFEIDASSCRAAGRTPSCSSPRPRRTSRSPRRCARTARSAPSASPAPWSGGSPGASGAAAVPAGRGDPPQAPPRAAPQERRRRLSAAPRAPHRTRATHRDLNDPTEGEARVPRRDPREDADRHASGGGRATCVVATTSCCRDGLPVAPSEPPSRPASSWPARCERTPARPDHATENADEHDVRRPRTGRDVRAPGRGADACGAGTSSCCPAGSPGEQSEPPRRRVSLWPGRSEGGPIPAPAARCRGRRASGRDHRRDSGRD